MREIKFRVWDKEKEELQRQINTRIINEKYIEENYISKDKIRNKIKDYTEKCTHPLINSQSRREYTFGLKILKELLEEE